MHIASLPPFVDRRQSTKWALAELLDRLVRNHPREIHLYARSVKDLIVTRLARFPLDPLPAWSGIVFLEFPAHTSCSFSFESQLTGFAGYEMNCFLGSGSIQVSLRA